MWCDIYKYIFWIRYYGSDIKPTHSISNSRWSAMVSHIRREYLTDESL